MLALRLIDRFAADTGEDLTYAREIAREAPAAFWKLALHGPLLLHRGHAPAALVHLARLGAMLVEDCGPCVQTAVNEARRAGVSPALLRAALEGGAELPALERDAYLLGRAVAGEAAAAEEVRDRLEGAIGRRGLVELSLAAAAVRIFPALKRGLGYARSCSQVQVEVA